MNDGWDKAEAWLQPRRFAMILAALVLIQFPAVDVGLKTFFFRDYGFFGYPLAQYHRDAFWNGEIPFWNPYNNAGLPFLAQWNTMVLYPGSLIYLLLPLPWSLGIFCLVHQFLAGLGMYLLGRDSAKSNLGGAIAGIAFAFSGLLLSSLKWPNNIAAFGLMPWVVWRCLCVAGPSPRPSPHRMGRGRGIGIAALVGGTQMLSGAPEVILLTWFVAGVLVIGEAIAQRSFGLIFSFVAIVALVAAIAAAQLWPFFDLLKLSQRTVAFAGSDWPMPKWGWANFFVPLFKTFSSYHGVPVQPNQYWISTYYVPLGALAFAIVSLTKGWRPCLGAAIALFGAIMALGENGLLYNGLRHILPSLGFMRFPIKYVILPVFILCWLAAFGVEKVASRKKHVSIYLVAFAFAVVIKAIPWLEYQPSEGANAFRANGDARLIFLVLFLLCSSVINHFRFSLLALFAAFAVIWLDARTHAPEQNPVAEKWVFDRGLPQITNAPTLGAGRAMISAEAALKLDHLIREKPEEDIGTSRLALFCNANLIDRIPKVDGFFSLYLQESAQLIDFIYANTNRTFPGLEKLLRVSHRTAPGKVGEWLDSTAQPWVFGVNNASLASRADTIQSMLSPDFDPTANLYLPIDSAAATNSASVAIRDIEWKTDRIRFIVSGTNGAWVVLSQAFHPGWSATANGKPVKVERANHAFQAIHVSPGESVIELRYRERRFGPGLIISIAGILVSAGMIARRP